MSLEADDGFTVSRKKSLPVPVRVSALPGACPGTRQL